MRRAVNSKLVTVVVALAVCACFLIRANVAKADELYAKIRGTVTDQSGAAVPNIKLTATNAATGVSATTKTEGDGSYEFPELPAPGVYSISTEVTGFKSFSVTGIHVNLNQIFIENIQLEIGEASQSVVVSETVTNKVEATSMQLGMSVTSSEIVNIPLNGRYYGQVMELVPGIVSNSDARGGNSYGNFSSNGSQADQDSYLINGTDNNDLPLNEVQTNPSPDALAEVTVVTGSINPEYSRNSGAIVNADIKSGTNSFHGDVFDFNRETALNASNFFTHMPEVDQQNQYGGTVGGPIWKNHTFFFFSYEGYHAGAPDTSGDCGCASPNETNVYSTAQRGGNFSTSDFNGTPATGSGSGAVAAVNPNVSPIPLYGDSASTCPVGGGVMCPAGTYYGDAYSGTALISHGLFSTGVIPTQDFNTVSSGLLKYVPMPNASGNEFTFSPVLKEMDSQYLARIDETLTSKDTLWGYFLWESAPSTETLPFYGANVPGFGEKNAETWSTETVAWIHTFSPSTINEVRAGYVRFNYASVEPETPMAPSTAGFTGITPQNTAGEGLPVVNVTGLFDLGFSQDGPQPRIDQTYQATDNVTRLVGSHAFKIGFDMRRFEVYNPFSHDNDGVFTFGGDGTFSTGVPGADFLLGIPDSYEQGSGDILNERAQEYYSYFQDQWKIKRNLTITYGVGWEIDTPMADIAHDNHAGIAFRPGQQSTVFPNAPAGYVFQGDSGVNAFGTTKFDHFAPRAGFAYALGDKMSIRGGYGIYYNRFSGETGLQTQGSPPFAETSIGNGSAGGSPSFANPYTGWGIGAGGAVTTVSTTNPFPYTPNPNASFAALEPFEISVYDQKITDPYAQNYTLTIERQLTGTTILSVGYVGSLGRHLLGTRELNPGINPAGCASGTEVSPIAADAGVSCIRAAASQPEVFPQNFQYNSLIFATVGDVTTEDNSNYNALQVSLNKNLSHGLQFLAAYTYSHALDDGSGFENSGFGGSGSGGFGELRSTNPFNPALDYGDSNYDARQRFVISYVYELPSLHNHDGFHWMPSRLTEGWQMSGITTFQSGFPLDVVDSAFPSLSASCYTYYSTCGSTGGWDAPNVAGKVTYVNPRTVTGGSNYWFSVSPNPFSAPAEGTEGNAGRDILHGPGLNNWDLAFMKDTNITESTKLELRIELFNAFNHTQFSPIGIITDFNNPDFGQETAAHDPRLIQLVGKFYF